MQGFDDAHRGERVRDHDAHEFFRRHVGDRLARIVRDARAHKQDIEYPSRQASAQRRDLIGLADIDGLDLQPASRLVREVVQEGSGCSPNRADDVPSVLEIFRGHCVAETAGGPNEQDRLGKGCGHVVKPITVRAAH